MCGIVLAPRADPSQPGNHRFGEVLQICLFRKRCAERQTCALREKGQLPNAEILVYLNRLSDVLWLMARWVEAREGGSAPGTALV